MRVPFQVTFDCSDPDALARFWADVLGYKVEDPPSGYASWQDFLKAKDVPESEWHSASAIIDPDGKGSRIYFQKFNNPKSTKNRVHLDVNTSGGPQTPTEERKKKVEAEAQRLRRLGATRISVTDEDDEFWIVMADPEGNEFCLQ